jgi:gliding motility-associated-like protein
MKRLILLFILLLSKTTLQLASAQLIVNTAPSPSALVNDVFVGTGVTVNNIEFNGQSGAIPTVQASYFSSFNSNIPILEGVLLTTGVGTVAVGPNNSGNDGSDIGVSYYDTDLNAISTASTNDEAVLEFDFIPDGDTLVFYYAFASEEYNEYVCSSFNDVFGFFISGPGISGPYQNGGINLAIVPGTNPPMPVAINNVNNGSFGAFGGPENCGIANLNNSEFYIDNEGNNSSTASQYDGFTTRLSSGVSVQCGQTYHIKFVIADAADGVYDSGIFLEANSFGSPFDMTMDLEIFTNGDPTILYEECGEGQLIFERFADIDSESWFYIENDAASTATNGVDYTLVPDSLKFTAGENLLYYNISSIPDDILEGLETAAFFLTTYVTECEDYPVVGDASFTIEEAPLINMTTYNPIIGCNDSVLLDPQPYGGYGDYDFSWSTGESDSVIWVGGAVETYYVTIGDSCGVVTVVDSFSVSNNEPPLIADVGIADTSRSCLDTLYLNGTVIGGNEEYDIYWLIGADTVFDQLGVFTLPPPDFDTYQLYVQDGCGTKTSDTVTFVYDETPLNIYAGDPAVATSCIEPVFLSGEIISPGAGEYTTFEWINNADSSIVMINSLIYVTEITETSTYTLHLIDVCGLEAFSEQTIVYDATPLNIDAGDPAVATSCIEPVFLSGEIISPGAGEYTTIEWINNTDSSVVMINSLIYIAEITETATYTLHLIDVCGLEAFSEQTMYYLPPPLVLDAGPDLTSLHCLDTLNLAASTEGGTGNNIFEWFNDGVLISNDSVFSVNITENQTYELIVTDQCGLADTAFVQLNFILEPVTPEVLGISEVCFGDELVFTSVAHGGAEPYTYQWNGDTPGDVDELSFTADSSAIFTLVITDICGTTGDTSIYVDVEHPIAGASFEYTDIDLKIKLFNASQPSELTYIWDFGDNSTSSEFEPSHVFGDNLDHIIYLTIMSERGCTDVYELNYNAPSVVFIPNTFTPNGDGINDYISIKGDNLKTAQMQIFNRWGKQVYEINSPDERWYGESEKNNKDLATSVYNYVIQWTDNRDASFQKSGSILLIR